MSVNKFGFMEEEHTHDDDNNLISPFHSHQINLDDLENVENFNEKGKIQQLYGFKLNGSGIYERAEIVLPKDLKLFDEKNIDSKTLYNIIYHKGQWKLMKHKHDWDIDIVVKNETVSCRGDSTEILRIYNLGKMIGNLVPLHGVYENTAILMKHHGEYFISANKKKNNRSVLEFVTKFKNDKNILLQPDNGTTFFIQGYLLEEMKDEIKILDGLTMKIDKLNNPKPFGIRVIKNKNEYNVESYPKELKIEVDSRGDVNFNQITLVNNKYILDRIALSTSKITDDEILFL